MSFPAHDPYDLAVIKALKEHVSDDFAEGVSFTQRDESDGDEGLDCQAYYQLAEFEDLLVEEFEVDASDLSAAAVMAIESEVEQYGF